MQTYLPATALWHYARNWLLGAATFGVGILAYFLLFAPPEDEPFEQRMHAFEQRMIDEIALERERRFRLKINFCWAQQPHILHSREQHNVVASACEQLQEQYRAQYGRIYTGR
jgi:hypothetical protein